MRSRVAFALLPALVLSAGVSAQSGYGPDAIARYRRQAALMEESWRRLQFDRYNTTATATHAWEPMGQAARAYLETFRTWRGRETELRRSLTALLRSGMPTLSGDPARDIQAMEVWSVAADRPMLVVSVTAAYLVGPVGQRFPRTARCSFLLWKEPAATLAQPLPDLSPAGRGWFYGKAARIGNDLVFAGGYGKKGAMRPAFLAYRQAGARWTLAARKTFDGNGECDLLPGGEIVVESSRDRGMTFAAFRGQKLQTRETYRRTGTGYVPTGVRTRPNEFGVVERFCEALQRNEPTGASPSLVSVALGAGLGEPYPMWFATPETGGAWVFSRMQSSRLTVRLRARFAGQGDSLRLASLARLP
ncbi:MAG: hypothetical protein KIS66_13425 [Fimbriimonadaceae bacterium]|nr:hypothetical protein [Fimbriimonadaceae bacterium]